MLPEFPVLTESPVPISKAPDAPLVPSPVLNTSDPDAPELTDAPDATVTAPVEPRDVPLLITTDPVDDAMAAPVATYKSPLPPEPPVVPELSTMAPDVPAVPALADRTATTPLPVTPAPDFRATWPPTEAPVPPVTTMSPPTESVASPPVTSTSP